MILKNIAFTFLIAFEWIILQNYLQNNEKILLVGYRVTPWTCRYF